MSQSGTYSIRFDRDWSITRNRRPFNYVPGTYRVPRDIPASIAQFAMKDGAAVKDMPKLETKKRKT